MEEPKDLIFILEEQLKFIKMTVTEREYLQNNINKLKAAINYTRCCTELNDKEKLTFDEYVKMFYKNGQINLYENKKTGKLVDIKDISRKYNTYKFDI